MLGKAIKAAVRQNNMKVPDVQMYKKRSATDPTKMSLIYKSGSRLFTQEITDLKTRAVESTVLSELPGSSAKAPNF